MILEKIILFTTLNIVLVNGGRSWFSYNCESLESPEWYCDSNSASDADIKQFHYLHNGAIYRFCVDGKWCKSPALVNDSTDLEPVDLVLITSIKQIPRCMIRNFPKLKTIHGMNAGITSIEAWAFWNLTNLRKINLSYNGIREIQYGVFSELPIYYLDLSWNEIVYIGQGSFHDMPSLWTLNISGNYLTIFDDSHFAIKHIRTNAAFPLETLLLKHNNLEFIYLKHFPFLDTVDLSHNQIAQISAGNSFHYKTILTKLDLSDNSLTELSLPPDWANIGILRFSFNAFMNPDSLFIANVGSVALDGNPWMCEEYTRLLQYLKINDIKLLKHNEDEKIYFLTEVQRENYPTCYVSSDNYTQKALLYYLSLKDTYKTEQMKSVIQRLPN